jgi:hypothetical protein
MKLNDELKFRELQVIFFMSMSEYPNDKERMEAGMKIFFKFIDKLVERECSAIVAQTAKFKVHHGGGSRGDIIS